MKIGAGFCKIIRKLSAHTTRHDFLTFISTPSVIFSIILHAKWKGNKNNKKRRKDIEARKSFSCLEAQNIFFRMIIFSIICPLEKLNRYSHTHTHIFNCRINFISLLMVGGIVKIIILLSTFLNFAYDFIFASYRARRV
jgi:hypothetical protein